MQPDLATDRRGPSAPVPGPAPVICSLPRTQVLTSPAPRRWLFFLPPSTNCVQGVVLALSPIKPVSPPNPVMRVHDLLLLIHCLPLLPQFRKIGGSGLNMGMTCGKWLRVAKPGFEPRPGCLRRLNFREGRERGSKGKCSMRCRCRREEGHGGGKGWKRGEEHCMTIKATIAHSQCNHLVRVLCR